MPGRALNTGGGAIAYRENVGVGRGRYQPLPPVAVCCERRKINFKREKKKERKGKKKRGEEKEKEGGEKNRRRKENRRRGRWLKYIGLSPYPRLPHPQLTPLPPIYSVNRRYGYTSRSAKIIVHP